MRLVVSPDARLSAMKGAFHVPTFEEMCGTVCRVLSPTDSLTISLHATVYFSVQSLPALAHCPSVFVSLMHFTGVVPSFVSLSLSHPRKHKRPPTVLPSSRQAARFSSVSD